MIHLAYLLPLLPLSGAFVLGIFGRRLGEPLAGWLGTATVLGSFVVACIEFAALLARHAPGSRSVTQVLWRWIPVGGFQVHVGLLVDPLSMTMVLFVTGISALIHLYSIGYMHGDRDFTKFFVYLNLFVGSMLLLVLGSNMLVTFVGWEGVGACSYWLISFWFERDSAASAGKKAFIYNRVGDVGFLLAMFLVFDKVGSLDYHVVFAHLSAFDPASRTAVVLLLFLAAAGKSAQLPLFPWLADAMEGPTPVSALIHAATMVTAGVYLMCRFNPMLSGAHDAQLVVASVGAATAFVAASIGATQHDIKKVLAYSTVSQLGYMFLAIGVGAYEAAIFLMLAHAFYKGLLFLGAGSVIHAMHDEQDLRRMGNLRRYMKLTAVTFGTAWLAIAGIPPLAGFWAKGDVLDNAFASNKALWAIGLVTAALTAYYLSRLMAMAFFGDERWHDLFATSAGSHGPAAAGSAAVGSQMPGSTMHAPAASGSPPSGAAVPAPLMHGSSPPQHAAGQPHEGPWVMGVPLVVLAFLAFFGGALNLPWHPSWDPLGWLAPVFGSRLYDAHQSAATLWLLGVADTVMALIGIGTALPLWTRQVDRPKLEPVFLLRAWYLDAAIDLVVSRGGQLLARFTGAVVEPKVVDGAVTGTVRLTGALGAGLRRVQTGFVRQYALGVVLGMVALLAYMISRTWM
ncbi:MAG: NADH-quinone oxidoreductase subunit L [Actinomycetota bacterium]|jgi:NADH-quinone oxidoreductase subunit L|nr:NADH-quinone oxidoreductase subunit L [Actinomycetota bacterium]